MSDHPLDLNLIRVGMACAVAAVITVGAFFVIRFWIETG
jgi:hypothetical protein